MRISDKRPFLSAIHALAPCPTGWEYDSHLTIELARLAVETGLQVLYEQEHGQQVLTRLP